jgi:uncharacterized protein (DUF169 family)
MYAIYGYPLETLCTAGIYIMGLDNASQKTRAEEDIP